MKTFAALITALVLVLGVAACGSGNDDGGDPTSPKTTGTDGTTKEGPTDIDGRPYVPGPSDNLIVYERSGGIAGVQERLIVNPDGEARLELGDQATRFKLTPEELEELRVSIGAANFEDLNARYGPPNGTVVADGFVTQITAEGRSTTVETEGDPPPVLENLMIFVNELIEDHR